jgi:hypothetical protein
MLRECRSVNYDCGQAWRAWLWAERREEVGRRLSSADPFPPVVSQGIIALELSMTNDSNWDVRITNVQHRLSLRCDGLRFESEGTRGLL